MPLQVKKVQMKLKDGQQYVDGDLLFNVDAQAWARGTRNGQTITNTNDPAYHNNAKYYSEQSAASATAAASAVLTGNLASEYSTSSTYAVGDYVLYNGGYYVCNTAITTAEAWTAAHWTAVKVGPEIGDLKNAFVVNNTVEGEIVNIFNYGNDTYRGTTIKTINGVVTIDGTAITGNGQYKLTGDLAHSVGGSSWVSDTLALIPGHRYALAINVYGGTYTHPSGSAAFPEVRLYGSDYAVPVLSVPIADESGLIKGTQISSFSVYNDNNLRYVTFFVVNGGVYGKLKIKIALIDLNDLDALIDKSNIAQTGYYEEIIYQGVKNYTDTGGGVSRYYATYIPKYDGEGNIIPLLPDYSTAYSPNEYARANYTTVTINAGMTTGETGNGAVIRNGEIIRESDYTTAGNYLLHLGIDKNRNITEYLRTATCAEMIADGVDNAFLVYYPLVHDGVILDFEAMNLPSTNYEKNPRMMMIERANGTIVFVAVDGRTKQSAGLTPQECAEMCLSMNANNAWQLDGGGSTSLSLKGVKLNANIDGTGLIDRDIHVTVSVPRKFVNQSTQDAGSYLGTTRRDQTIFFQRQINTINNIINYIAQESGIDISGIT